MRRSSRALAATSVASVLLLCVRLAADPPAFDFVGVWQMCYEPGLEDVSEPSEGYLVLMPDFTYFELREDCCLEEGQTRESNAGTYRIEGSIVALSSKRTDGERYDRRLELVREAPIVLFDDLHGVAQLRPVLKIGRNLNYGFAKVYPHEQ
jgi:hypothetical protein